MLSRGLAVRSVVRAGEATGRGLSAVERERTACMAMLQHPSARQPGRVVLGGCRACLLACLSGALAPGCAGPCMPGCLRMSASHACMQRHAQHEGVFRLLCGCCGREA